MKIGQSTIEKMTWWIIVLLLLTSIATFAKLTSDDTRKFKVLKQNQEQIICVMTKFADFTTTTPSALKAEINNCVKE